MKKEKREDVKVKSIQYPDGQGGVTLTLSHSKVALVAHEFVKYFKEVKGTNYVEFQMTDAKDPDFGLFTVTIQRAAGKTPAKKTSEAREALRLCVDRLQEIAGSGAALDAGLRVLQE